MKKSVKMLLGLLAMLAATASTAALAHPTGNSGGAMMDRGMMDRGMMKPGAQHEMMQRMHRGNRGAGGMMRSMGTGMGHHMDGGRMMGGMRVTSVQHLSVDDVSHFFGHHLERHDNKRLTLGDVSEKDKDTITARIVTLEGSLVQAFEVDRHSGMVKRVE